MTPEDLSRLATADDRDRTHGFVCPCGARPTCPMLLDELWNQIKPPPTVTVTRHRSRRNPEASEHETRTERVLLCTACAETRLGRRLTAEDLAVCVGNFGAAIMLRRECALLDEALDLLEQVDDFIDTSESEAAARIAKAAARIAKAAARIAKAAGR